MNHGASKRFLAIFLLMAIMAFFVNWRDLPKDLGSDFKQAVQSTSEHTTITNADAKIEIEIAETPIELIKGLSGRLTLAENSGLLFIFPYADTHGIWMKEMNFPIDIIWFDENYQIVAIKENARPDSYPEVFTPPTPAFYVLEVPSGFAQKNKISVGMIGHF